MDPSKEIVIISGKGGTGKTSVTAALASLAQNGVLADCDVDAADLHLLMTPEIIEQHDFVGGKEAHIRKSVCIDCGRCKTLCRFNAIEVDSSGKFEVDSTACEGCKVCVEFCPVKAIDFLDAVNGQWFIADTRFGPMVHAELGIAQENSGKLVSLIRREAKRIAKEKAAEWILIDGSPGTGCPVIASITGADFVLVVTEPTQSGKHDLLRIIELAAHFNVSAAVCINKADINPRMADEIEAAAEEKGLPVLARIPYDSIVTRAQVEAKTVMEMPDNDIANSISNLWNQIQKRI